MSDDNDAGHISVSVADLALGSLKGVAAAEERAALAVLQ